MIHTHALESGSVCQNIEIYILAAVLSFKTSLCEQINPVLHPSAPRPSVKKGLIHGRAGVLLLCLLYLFCLAGTRAFQFFRGPNSQELPIDSQGPWSTLPSDMHGPVTLVQFSSVIQSCPNICDPMDCSTPGLPVHHQLPEFTQTHVHWISDTIQTSYPLSSHSPPACNLFQHQGLFKWVSSSH